MTKTSNTKILFLSRRYPPSMGGIQTHCYHMYTLLSNQVDVKLVALSRQHLIHLVWFVPYTYLVSLFEVLFRKVDTIYFSDGVICCLATFLRPFTRARFIVTIYGLELTFSHLLFSKLMKWGIARCERVLVISEHTGKITAEAGVPKEKIHLIYLGVEPRTLTPERQNVVKKAFESEHGISFDQEKVILNFGRQVRRKGLVPFLQKGFPLLDPDIRLIIGMGSTGEEIPGIKEEAKKYGDRIMLLDHLDNDTAAMLRAESDVFIMPNLAISTDAEGFGIAPLEAMYVGVLSVAFAVDALVESVNEWGYMVDPGDYQGFVDKIHEHLGLAQEEKEARGTKASEYVRREYTWEKTAQEYLEVFEGRA
jgi:glycosyltransferase involved in cell wall biosynthesis